MQESFNLVTAGLALQKKWKLVLGFTLVAGLVAGITVFLMPRYFRSTSVIMSANPLLADKARLFNDNIQSLYSYFGDGDDLDRIQGIADMDAMYKKLVDEFLLVDYYHVQDKDPALARGNAVLKLRNDIHFERTEKGLLKIIAWTKQKELSAELVNRMVSIATELVSAIWEKNYSQGLTNLNQSIENTKTQYQQLKDSLAIMSKEDQELAAVKLQSLLDQLKEYMKSAAEFRVASKNASPLLYVLDPAVPAAKAERPDKLTTILVGCLLGFMFSSLFVIITNRKTVA